MAKGSGFLSIAQALVNYGARYGFQDVRDHIRHPSNLKKSLPNIVRQTKMKIQEDLNRAPSYPRFSFTTDMWTEKYHQRSFLSLSVHYISSEFQVKTHLLAVDEFPNVPKTTDNIRLECERILSDYFADPKKVMEESIAVTDGGSNMVSVFPNRLPCMCHRLNLVMHWMLNDNVPKETSSNQKDVPLKKQFVLSQSCPTFHATVAGVKGVVTYFKQSGLNSRLEYSLKQEVETRWNSKLIMLESYRKSQEEVQKLLLEKNQIGKIISIDESALNELIKFLTLFKECTEVWSKEKTPSIQNVVICIEKLRRHVAPTELDSDELIQLKAQADICIQEYLDVPELYYLACMLNPLYKKLKFVEESRRVYFVSQLKEFLRQYDTNEEVSGEPKTKHSKRDEFQDSSDDDEDDNKDEVDRYLELKLSKGTDPQLDVLSFWRNASDFPTLKKVALGVLCIPASQTTDERVFSSTGNTLSPRRTEPKGSTLSELTFLHKNYLL